MDPRSTAGAARPMPAFTRMINPTRDEARFSNPGATMIAFAEALQLARREPDGGKEGWTAGQPETLPAVSAASALLMLESGGMNGTGPDSKAIPSVAHSSPPYYGSHTASTAPPPAPWQPVRLVQRREPSESSYPPSEGSAEGSGRSRSNSVDMDSSPLPTDLGSAGHACPLCHKVFVSASKVKRHFLVHTRDKPFHCTDCGTRFTQKGALKVHMQRKHAEMFDEEEFKRMSEAQEKQVRASVKSTHHGSTPPPPVFAAAPLPYYYAQQGGGFYAQPACTQAAPMPSGGMMFYQVAPTSMPSEMHMTPATPYYAHAMPAMHYHTPIAPTTYLGPQSMSE